MRLIEFRIFMPLTVEENYIAQLWSMAEVSRLNTSGGEGVEIIKNEIFNVPANVDELTKYLPDFDSSDVSKYKYHKSKKLHSSKSLNALPKNESLKSNGNQNGNHDEDEVEEEDSGLNENDCTKDDTCESNGDSHTLVKHSNTNGESNGDSNMYSSLPNTMNSAENLKTKFDKTYINNAKSIESVSSSDSQTSTGGSRKGQYTYKVYKIASKFPWFIRKILPRESTILHEKSWNLYPLIKTHIRNEYMKKDFHVFINTITKECIDGKVEENVHNLTPEQLKKREIIIVDICEPVSSKEYVESEDPTKYRSAKANRGPLKNDWISTQRPLICCYKLVELEFIWFPLQGKAEGYMGGFYKKLFGKFHRQIFCWMDKWYGLGIKDLRKYEAEVQRALSENINQGEIANNPFDDSEK